ncbi:MAG: hypothetical protein P8J61_02475 [Gammaproteobacteria bacterium]|jgi:hypothetical protein|nr:hypothetical protein [Gammaproteobacteria bacterium]
MTIKFSKHVDKNLVIVNISSQISNAELINAFRSYYESNKDNADFDQLILFEDTAEFKLGTESFIQLSKMADDFLKQMTTLLKQHSLLIKPCTK